MRIIEHAYLTFHDNTDAGASDATGSSSDNKSVSGRATNSNRMLRTRGHEPRSLPPPTYDHSLIRDIGAHQAIEWISKAAAHGTPSTLNGSHGREMGRGLWGVRKGGQDIVLRDGYHRSIINNC